MLTANDIHYVVGLLSRVASEDDVEIELGDFVFDKATKTERDVDVTIKVKQRDGKLSVFKGFEVKDHARKLTSEHVEQLCQKLNDMPDLTHRAIVSASGYTKPSIKKARYHGIDLFELRNWEKRDDTKFATIPVEGAVEVYMWKHLSPLKIRSSEAVADEILAGNPRVFIEGEDKPLAYREWLNEIAGQCRNQAQKEGGASIGEGIQLLNCTGKFIPPKPVWLETSAKRVLMEEIGYEGILERRITRLPSERKVLVKLGEAKPIAGCCVSDGGPLGLMGLSISGDQAELVTLPVSMRNRAKIFRQKL